MCSYVSMKLLITQSELSKPFKPQWVFVFNVIPKGFQDSKETFTTFLLVWERALKGAKAAPVCLAHNLLCFADLLQVMVIVWGSEIMGYFYKSTKSITNRFIPQLLSGNLLFRRGRQGRLDGDMFLISESLNISFFRINLSKAEDGVEVHEGDQVLHQLWAPPEFLLSLTYHVSAKT